MTAPVWQAIWNGNFNATLGSTSVLLGPNGLSAITAFPHIDGSSPSYGVSCLARNSVTKSTGLVVYDGSVDLPTNGIFAGDKDFSMFFSLPTNINSGLKAASRAVSVDLRDGVGQPVLPLTFNAFNNVITTLYYHPTNLVNSILNIPYTFVGGEQVVVKYEAPAVLDGTDAIATISIYINGVLLSTHNFEVMSVYSFEPWGQVRIQAASLGTYSILQDLRIYDILIDQSTVISSTTQFHSVAGPVVNENPIFEYYNEGDFLTDFSDFQGAHSHIYDYKNEKAVWTNSGSMMVKPSGMIAQGATEFTISTRIRPQNTGGYGIIMGQEFASGGPERGLLAFFSGSSIAVQLMADPSFGSHGVQVGGTQPFIDPNFTEWVTLTIVANYNTGTLRLFKNGVEIPSALTVFGTGLTGKHFGGQSANASFDIGGCHLNNFGINAHMRGGFSNFKFWDHALTDTEVMQDHNDNVTAEAVSATTPVRSYVDISDYSVVGTIPTFTDPWGNTNAEFDGTPGDRLTVSNVDLFKWQRVGTLAWWQKETPNLEANPFWTDNVDFAGQFSFYRPTGSSITGNSGDFIFIIKGQSQNRNLNHIPNAQVGSVFTPQMAFYTYTYNANTQTFKLYKNGVSVALVNDTGNFNGFEYTANKQLNFGSNFIGRHFRHHFFVRDLSAAEIAAFYNAEAAALVSLNQPIPDQQITVGYPFSYTFPSSTFNGDSLTYTATLLNGDPLPNWITFNSATRTFSGTPTMQVPTFLDFAIKVTASSTASSATDDFVLRVSNNAPIAITPIANQTARAGVYNEFDFGTAVFMDFDNHALTYSATLANGDPLPSWITFDFCPTCDTRFAFNPSLGEAGTTVQLKVIATDAYGATGSTLFSLYVCEPVPTTDFEDVNGLSDNDWTQSNNPLFAADPYGAAALNVLSSNAKLTKNGLSFGTSSEATVSCWIKGNGGYSLLQSMGIMEQLSTSAGQFALYNVGPTIYFRVYNNGSLSNYDTFSALAPLNTTEWYNVLAKVEVISGTSVGKIFVNGISIPTTKVSTGTGFTQFGGSPQTFAIHKTGNFGYDANSNLIIARPKIWFSAIDDCQAAWHYDNELDFSPVISVDTDAWLTKEDYDNDWIAANNITSTLDCWDNYTYGPSDGYDDYLKYNKFGGTYFNSFNTLNVTKVGMSCWFKVDGSETGDFAWFFSQGNASANRRTWDLGMALDFLNAGRIVFFKGSDDGNYRGVITQNAYNDGEHHHIYVDWELGNKMDLYVDGQIVPVIDISIGASDDNWPVSFDAETYIYRKDDPTNYAAFSALRHRIRITDVLSPLQIEQEYMTDALKIVEIAPTFEDVDGLDTDWTEHNNPIYVPDQHMNAALDGDGSGYLSHNQVVVGGTGKKRYSATCWVKRTADITSTQTIMGQTTTAASGRMFNIGVAFDGIANNICGTIHTSSAEVTACTTAGKLELNKWHHIAAVMNLDGNYGKIYLDGELVTDYSTRTYLAGEINNAPSTKLLVGAMDYSSPLILSDKLMVARPKIWDNVELSNCQIHDEYAKELLLIPEGPTNTIPSGLFSGIGVPVVVSSAVVNMANYPSGIVDEVPFTLDITASGITTDTQLLQIQVFDFDASDSIEASMYYSTDGFATSGLMTLDTDNPMTFVTASGYVYTSGVIWDREADLAGYSGPVQMALRLEDASSGVQIIYASGVDKTLVPASIQYPTPIYFSELKTDLTGYDHPFHKIMKYPLTSPNPSVRKSDNVYTLTGPNQTFKFVFDSGDPKPLKIRAKLGSYTLTSDEIDVFTNTDVNDFSIQVISNGNGSFNVKATGLKKDLAKSQINHHAVILYKTSGSGNLTCDNFIVPLINGQATFTNCRYDGIDLLSLRVAHAKYQHIFR